MDCILRAIRRQLRLDHGVPLAVVEADLIAGPHVDDDPLNASMVDFAPDVSLTEGAYDEYTGALLDPEKVLEARVTEIDFFKKLDCWDVVPTSRAWDETGKAPIPTRWIDHDKNAGDEKLGLDLRSRLVVCETKKRSSIAADDIVSVYSATPPLEIFRLQCSLAMSLPYHDGESMCLIFLDISRAHPHCKVLRQDIFVSAPPELGLGPNFCLHLKCCIYGLRDANQAFQFKVKETFEFEGFNQGRFSPCAYHHGSRPVSFGVRGDDYVGCGPRNHLLQFANALSKHLIVKIRGLMGPRKDDLKTIKLLARTITWHDRHEHHRECITWEADDRHVDILCERLGINPSSNPRATTADKAKWASCPPLSGDELNSDLVPVFKSCCMRLNFVALDRVDIAFLAKELARTMSRPTKAAFEHMKHLVRYLLGNRRLVWVFRRQHLPTHIDIFCDSNWAGCTVTRKSTTSFVACLGQHTVATGAFTQAVISLSAGEVEFYALVKTCCRGIGLRSLLVDMNHDFKIRINSDSSAALGMAARCGAQSVRHIETQALWVQSAVGSRKILIKKKNGKQNASDVGTKILDSLTMVRLLESVNLYIVRQRQ